MKKLGIVLMAALTAHIAFTPVFAADAMDPKLKEKAQRAVDNGIRYLRDHQESNGSWSKSVGITALATRAFLESHRKYNEEDGPYMTKPVKFILSNVHEDGSIGESNQNRNYNTAVSITALQATGNATYAPIIKKAQKYLANLQIDEGEDYKKDHKYYGGIGYGGDERPDLSNQYMAIEGLKSTAFDPKDPLWEKALVFINRAQNRSESNDQSWAANDGGFTYMPGHSPHGGTASYGSMTHAGLFSLLFAGVDKKDPRVQAAYNWIRANYTVDDNPGAKNKQGLYYYYQTFAKAMAAYGDSEVTDTSGAKHNWRNDLATKLLSLQTANGSWINSDSPRWWEGDQNLVTAWCIIALNTVTK